MNFSFFKYIFVTLLLLQCVLCFRVEFREEYNVHEEPCNTPIFKRDASHFFDKASFSFNGFEKIDSVPVIFPLDLCIMDLNGIKYASALHIGEDGIKHFKVYKKINNNYHLLTDIETPLAIAMDCRENNEKGYIALAYNITARVDNAKDGAPVFQIADDHLRPVQYFPDANVAAIFLHNTGDHLYMLQAFKNTEASPNLKCPFFKWSGSSFNRKGFIPCSNARQVELFSMDYENYVAVANYADHLGRTDTDSEVYKYDEDANSFQLLQRIPTSGAVDVKHFSVPFDGVQKRHFLIFGNSIRARTSLVDGGANAKREYKNLQANSVFYIFDGGQFVPYQQMSFYDVQQFLPVQSSNAEKFLLLVACDNQAMKILNFNDWKFEESNIQFTEGALGRGISKMRVFQANDQSYLLIANELMLANEAHVFQPIFKQDEHANTLRQEIIEWAQTNIERLTAIDVDQLKKDVELKLSTRRRVTSSPTVSGFSFSKIKSAVTKALVHPRKSLSKNFWKALKYTKGAVDILQKLMKVVAIRRRKRDVPPSSGDYEFSRLNIETLVVRDKIRANKVNNYGALNATLKRIDATKVIVTGSYDAPKSRNDGLSNSEGDGVDAHYDVLSVDDLVIHGKVNNFTWTHLYNNTLKRKGDQVVLVPVQLASLQVERLNIEKDEINGRNIQQTVDVDRGNYVVDQSLNFTSPVHMKKLTVKERLNNISVIEDRLDVLRHNYASPQVITGTKELESFRVLKPITVTTEINEIKGISPIGSHKIINENINLDGDFTIMGDITIGKLINAEDITAETNGISVKRLLHGGLRMDQPLQDVNIRFVEPLVANSSVVTFVNAKDVQDLVRTNTSVPQKIDGEKVFKGALEIRNGFSEVKTLNGIDTEGLEKLLLSRDANQTITAPWSLDKVTVKSVTSPKLYLKSQNLSDYLTISGDQSIRGSIKVNKLKVNSLLLNDLRTNKKIFNNEVTKIYRQKILNMPTFFQKGHKFHGSIFVGNLQMNNDTNINGRAAELLERQLAIFDGNVKYVGSLTFNIDMVVNNLTFHGHFNGISTEKFGKNWLQKHGDQNFSAPQTLTAVHCESDAIIKGKLNGHSIMDFLNNTYWIDRDEHIPNASFESPLQMDAKLTSKSFNGLLIPEEIILKEALQQPVTFDAITIHGDLVVDGHISAKSRINGIPIANLIEYLNMPGITLHVDNANFSYPPHYETLNGRDLKQTLDAVWLANENIDVQGHLEITEGIFEGLIELQGPINNVNIKYLQENYLSLSRPQYLSKDIMFINAVEFQDIFKADTITLMGNIVEPISQQHLNFNLFANNVFKKSGPQVVSGQWNIQKAIVHGNLRNIFMNELNLRDDVVRNDVALNEIHAPKCITSSNLRKLYASPNSYINDVNMDAWVRDTVFIYENYTIYGTITLDSINVYDNVIVDGTVNDVVLRRDAVLLREYNQTVSGAMRIHNKLIPEKQILATNFENLWVKFVNNRNISEFNEHRVERRPVIRCESELIFTNPLLLAEFDMSESNGRERHVAVHNKNAENSWKELYMVLKSLQMSYNYETFFLDDFETIQLIEMTAKDLYHFPLCINHTIVDFMAITTNGSNVELYRWNDEYHRFEIYNDTSWLPQDNSKLKLFHMIFKNMHFVDLEDCAKESTGRNNILSKVQDIQNILEVGINDPKLEIFTMNRRTCIAVHSSNNDLLSIYCLNISTEKPGLTFVECKRLNKTPVRQVMKITEEMIAMSFDDSIEIWRTATNMQFIQRINTLKPNQMVMAIKDDIIYLCVLVDKEENSLYNHTVQIYSSIRNAPFKLLQTIDCDKPLQLAFLQIESSNDLLLNVLTNVQDRPLLIYQFKGVDGFQKIVDISTLLPSFHVRPFKLCFTNHTYLFAMLNDKCVSIVEVKINKL